MPDKIEIFKSAYDLLKSQLEEIQDTLEKAQESCRASDSEGAFFHIAHVHQLLQGWPEELFLDQ